MLLTVLHYLIAWFQGTLGNSRAMQYAKLLRGNARSKSLVIGKKKYLDKNPAIGSRLASLLHTSHKRLLETVLREEQGTVFASVPTSIQISLDRWTSYLDKQQYVPPRDEDTCHIIISLVDPINPEEFLDRKLSLAAEKRCMVQDFVEAIAWKPGSPFGIIAESTIEKMAKMTEAFIDGHLFMDDLLDIQEITTIDVGGHAVNLLRTASNPGPIEFAPPTPRTNSLTDLKLVSDPITEEGRPRLLSEIDEQQFDQTNHSIASFGSADILDDASQGMPGEHEAWSEMCENDPSISGCAVIMEGSSAAGEALSESVQVLAPEVFTPYRRRKDHDGKPPNVLIYCGKKDSRRIFDGLKSVFEQCLNPEKYAVYHLAHDHVFTTPWMENATLLIISGSKVYDGVDQVFLNFFRQGGCVLSFSGMFASHFMTKVDGDAGASVLSLNYKHWRDVTVISGRVFFDDSDSLLQDVSLTTIAKDKTGAAVITEANHELSGGVVLISQAKLNKDPVMLAISPEVFSALKRANPARFEILQDLFVRLGMDCEKGEPPALSPCYLLPIHNELMSALMDNVKTRLRAGLLKSKDMTLKFISSEKDVGDILEDDILPVIKTTDLSSLQFDFNNYSRHLKTKSLGNTVFYIPVIKTTMTVFDGLMFSVPDSVGLIAIAHRQTSGRGRGGNVWISPIGCAMFTLHVKVDLLSPLGQRVAYLQHIASLAVVEAVRSIQGYQDIDMRLKWPNDIYFGNAGKLGGVIVNSSCMGKTMHANIGCGFNVSNKDPTICINDLVRRHNHTHGTNLAEFTIEELLGRTVTKMEEIIDLFLNEGMESFLDLYYKRWLHQDAVVHLESEGCDAQVVGLDEYGFLKVRTKDGEVSVHPDGNSFDIMKNLIIPKTR